MSSYAIVKMEFPNPFRYTEVMQRGLTLEEAQAHCQRDDTRAEGEWFHAYMDEEHLRDD